MLIPIGDDNDEGHSHIHHDFVHYGLILLCIGVFSWETWIGVNRGHSGLEAVIDQWSFDPRGALGNGYLKKSFSERFVTLVACFADLRNLALVKSVTSTFLHGSPLHLLSNMLVLWMLGDNVEHAMGHLRYLFFFILAGILSDMGQLLFVTHATLISSIGASGAIMAVAGAYLVYFPKARINLFYFFGFWWGVISPPARLVIAIYIAGEMFTAWKGYGTNYGMVGVWAHVTGFMSGVLLAFVLRKNRKEPLVQPHGRRPYNRNVLKAIRERQHPQDPGDPWGH